MRVRLRVPAFLAAGRRRPGRPGQPAAAPPARPLRVQLLDSSSTGLAVRRLGAIDSRVLKRPSPWRTRTHTNTHTGRGERLDTHTHVHFLTSRNRALQLLFGGTSTLGCAHRYDVTSACICATSSGLLTVLAHLASMQSAAGAGAPSQSSLPGSASGASLSALLATGQEPSLLREQDRLLPVAPLVRLMKLSLVPSAKISSGARDLVCVLSCGGLHEVMWGAAWCAPRGC